MKWQNEKKIDFCDETPRCANKNCPTKIVKKAYLINIPHNKTRKTIKTKPRDFWRSIRLFYFKIAIQSGISICSTTTYQCESLTQKKSQILTSLKRELLGVVDKFVICDTNLSVKLTSKLTYQFCLSFRKKKQNTCNHDKKSVAVEIVEREKE